MFPCTHACIKLPKFHLYFTIYNLISEATPKNEVYFVNVQKAAVRVPAMLKTWLTPPPGQASSYKGPAVPPRAIG
jgi:hypothetical protein